MPPNSTAAAKRQPLTLAQLSTYDDILTDALVDHVSTIPNNLGYFPPTYFNRNVLIDMD